MLAGRGGGGTLVRFPALRQDGPSGDPAMKASPQQIEAPNANQEGLQRDRSRHKDVSAMIQRLSWPVKLSDRLTGTRRRGPV